MGAIAKMDEWGKPAWITAMILGFVFFWPIGLAILGYMIWSGRMGCRHHGMDGNQRQDWRTAREEWRSRKREMRDQMRARWHGHQTAMQPSGNAAFDDYKVETLKRLEEEQAQFNEFLDNLRRSRDKAQFDEFMQSQRSGVTVPEDRPDNSDSANSA